MALLKKAIKDVNENCGMDMEPGSLTTFLIRRTAADEEEVGMGDEGGMDAIDPVGPTPPEPNDEEHFDTNIEDETIENDYFRKVLFTTEQSQLVLMSLRPGEEIGTETHDGDQFFRFEAGEGVLIMGDKEVEIEDGTAAVVSAGVEHNVINTSDSEDLKLYAIYSPPQHAPGTIDKDKPNEEH